MPPGVAGRGLAGAAWAPGAGRLALALEAAEGGGGRGGGEVALLAASPGPVLTARLVGVVGVSGSGGEEESATSPPLVALADAGGTGGAAVGALLAARVGAGRVEVVPLAVRV